MTLAQLCIHYVPKMSPSPRDPPGPTSFLVMWPFFLQLTQGYQALRDSTFIFERPFQGSLRSSVSSALSLGLGSGHDPGVMGSSPTEWGGGRGGNLCSVQSLQEILSLPLPP